MATQTKRTQTESATSEAASNPSVVAGAFAEITREQMAAAIDNVATMFRAGEAMQRAGLQMGQRLSLLHDQAAENIRKATSPVELASIQSMLAVYQAQETMRYWQELTTAVVKAGSEALRPVQGERAAAATGASQAAAPASAAATMMDAAFSAAAPMADALQQMFTAPLKAATQQSSVH